MRLDLLEGVRTLQWSGLHPSHASGITHTLIHPDVERTPVADLFGCTVLVIRTDGAGQLPADWSPRLVASDEPVWWASVVVSTRWRLVRWLSSVPPQPSRTALTTSSRTDREPPKRAQGSSSTGSPTTTWPGSTVDP